MTLEELQALSDQYGMPIEDIADLKGIDLNNIQQGSTEEPEQDPLTIDIRSRNMGKVEDYFLTQDDFYDESGERLSEEKLEDALTNKLNVLGIEPEQYGVGENMMLKTEGQIAQYGNQISGWNFVTGDDVFEDQYGISAFKLSDVVPQYKDDNTGYDFKIDEINKWIAENANMDYFNQVVKQDKDMFDKLTAHVDVESGVTRDEAKDKLRESDEGKFTDIRDGKLMQINALDGTHGKMQRVGGKGDKVSREDFETENMWNKYQAWNNGEALTYTDDEADSFIADATQKLKQKKYSEFKSDASREDRRKIDVMIKGLEKQYTQDLDSLIALDKDYQTKANTFAQNVKAYEANPTVQGFQDLYADQIDLIRQEDQLMDLFTSVEGASKVVPIGLQNFNKNYNRMAQLTTGFKGVGASILYAAGTVNAYTSPQAINNEYMRDLMIKPFADLKDDMNYEAGMYQIPIGVDEISSFKDAGRWLASSTVNLIPSLSMAFTGPAALPLFFATGFAEGHSTQMIAEFDAAKKLPRVMEEYEKLKQDPNADPLELASYETQIQQLTDTLNVPEWRKLTTGMAYGIAEVVFEKFGTMALIKNARKGLKLIPPDSVKEGFKWAGKTIFKGNLREGGSEFGTTILQNSADVLFLGEDKNIFEGGLETFAQGALMGGGINSIAGVRMIKATINSEIATKKELADLNEIKQKIAKLTGLPVEADLETMIKKAGQGGINKSILKEVKALTGEYNAMAQKIFDKLGKGMSIEQAFNVGEINRQMRQVNNKWGQYLMQYRNGDISKKQLQEIEAKFRTDFDGLVQKREALLNNAGLEAENLNNHREINLNTNFQKIRDLGGINAKADGTIIKEYEDGLIRQYDALGKDAQLELENTLLEKMFGKVTGNKYSKKMREKAKQQAKQDWIESKVKEDVENGIQNAKDYSKDSLKDETDIFDIAETDAQVIKAFLQSYGVTNQKNLSKKAKAKLAKLKEALKDGSFNGVYLKESGRIIIHKTNAINNRAVGVGSHELLHHVMEKENKQNPKYGQDLYNWLEINQPEFFAVVKENLDANYASKDKDGNVIKGPNYFTEVIQAVSDVMSDQSAPDLNAEGMSGVRNFMKGALPSGLFEKIFGYEQGEKLFDFVRGFNAEAQFGGKAPRAVRGAKGAIAPDDSDERLGLRPNVEREELDLSVTKNDITSGVTVKEKDGIFKASDKAFEDAVGMYNKPFNEMTREEKLGVGFFVGEAWSKFRYEGKPWLRKQLDKRFDQVPGYKNLADGIVETLATGVEKGDNGIPYLVATWKPEGGRSLTSHIYGELHNRINHVIQLPKFSALGRQQVVDSETGQFDFDRFSGNEGVLGGINTQNELDTEMERLTGEMRSLLGVQKGGKLYKKVLNNAKNALKDKQGLLQKDPKKYRQALEKEFVKELKNEITELIGTKKSDKFKEFISKEENVKMLIDILGVKHRNKAGIKLFTEFGGEMDTKQSDAAMTDIDASFVKNRKAGNAIWNKKQVTPELMAEIQKVFVEGRETAYNSLRETLAMELGLDAVHQALREDTDLDNQYEGLTGQVTEAIKRDSELDFSRTINKLGVLERAVWEQNKAEFLDKLKEAPNFSRSGMNSIWKSIDGLKGFTTKQKNAILDDFARMLKPFERVKQEIDITKMEDAASYLEVAMEGFDLGQDLKTIFSLPHTPGYYFNQIGSIKSYEKFNKQIGIDLVEHFKKDILDEDGKVIKKGLSQEAAQQKAADMIIKFYMPSVKNSGKTGSGIWSKKSGQWKKDGRGGDNRYNLYESTEHIYKSLIKGIDPSVEVLGKGKNKYFGRNGKRIDIKKPDQNANDYVNNSINYQERKDAAKEARDFIKLIMPIAKEASNNNVDLAMFMQGMSSNMDTVLRSAALLQFTPVNSIGNNANLYRYEHMIPARVISMYLIDHYFKGNKGIDIDNLFSTYTVAIIPKTMDTHIGKMFGSTMTAAWKPGMPSQSRYYNNFTLGGPSFAIKDIQSGNEFGNYHQAVHEAIQDNQLPNPEDVKMLEVYMSKTTTKVKGISVFDFDDTLARTNSQVIVITKEMQEELEMNREIGNRILRERNRKEIMKSAPKINATEFAKMHAELESQGAEFDFSEFNEVIDGKKGPLFDLAMRRQDKFGSGDIFILTARPQESAPAIKAFMEGLGINIPLKNITGLADGRPEAKALWIADKVAEGYNNFYFADDALPNVQAVKDLLDQFDVKQRVEQAKLDFSKSKTKVKIFNDIIEETTGVKSDATFSDIVAKRQGEKKGRYTFYLPPHAEDFKGLMYMLLAKGEKGTAQYKWIKENLIDPYFKGVMAIKIAKQTAKNNYLLLVKSHDVKKKLKETTPDGTFTNDHAIRVYLWDKAGYDIPGISKRDKAKLIKHVEGDSQLMGFATDLLSFPGINGTYMKPDLHWDVGSITGDIDALTNKVGRKKFIQEFVDNKNEIFTKETLNKLEAIFGRRYRDALEDILFRMENGTNRNFGGNKLVNGFMNWINDSVGVVMFFNIRSATLQSISTVNFINWGDNNIFAAAKAFANQKQFWSDFVMIFNSPMLKQRRSGLQINVQEAELANAVKNAKSKTKAALSYLLKKGFLPTQIVDSFAIAAGGASFYRNRFNKYKKQGLDNKAAHDKAFQDMADIAEETQQSSDPALISEVQASPLGRLLFAWQNTPFQYNRNIKRAAQDLINRRRYPGMTQFQSDITNISKIIYYGGIQNFVFSALQSGLFAMLPGFGGDEDEDQIKQNEKELAKQIRVANNMLDTFLRGSGLPGAVVSTVKNIIMEYSKQQKKGYMADHAYTIIQVANFSPPIGSKVRKLYGAINTYKFDKDVIDERGFAPDSPAYKIIGNIVSASLNIPMDRLVNKMDNIQASLDERNEAWQRVATALGWNAWDVGAEVYPEHELIKARAKERRKQEGIEKRKETNRLKKLDIDARMQKKLDNMEKKLNNL